MMFKEEEQSMQRVRNNSLPLPTAAILLAGVVFGSTATAIGAEPDREALIRDALSAAPPAIARTASVMDWDHKILKQGSGAYTCMPSDPDTRAAGGRDPMCVDQVWMAWTDSYVGKKPFKTDRSGIAYMLAGDSGASNIDPYATGPTADNQWVAEGPHIMVLLPDASQLEGFSTDPNSGGAYVMWKGTPYAHVMVPVAQRPAAQK
jgi:hypothetical protein